MNEITITLLVLGLPGIICYFLCEKLIGKQQRSVVELIMLVFMYSALAYTLVSLIHAIYNFARGMELSSDIVHQFLTRKVDISKTLFPATAAGILLAYILSYLNHYSVINRMGQKINATRRYGDQDVWHYFHNAPDVDKNKGWIIIRDHKTKLAYHGYVSVWSDTGMDRELILSDASVFTNNTSEHLYDVRHIYLNRKKDDITIEVPPEKAIDLKEYSRDNDKKGGDK